MSEKLPIFRTFIFDPKNLWKKERVSILLDTGATRSVISNNLKFLASPDCIIRNSSIILQSFNGKNENSQGEVSLGIQDRNGNSIIMNALISGLVNYNMILGWNEIKNFKIKIDKPYIFLCLGSNDRNKKRKFEKGEVYDDVADRGDIPAISDAADRGNIPANSDVADRGDIPAISDAANRGDVPTNTPRPQVTAYRGEKPVIEKGKVSVEVRNGQVFTGRNFYGVKFKFDLFSKNRFYTVDCVEIGPSECKNIRVCRQGNFFSDKYLEIVEGVNSCEDIVVIPKIVGSNEPFLDILLENIGVEKIVIHENSHLASGDLAEPETIFDSNFPFNFESSENIEIFANLTDSKLENKNPPSLKYETKSLRDIPRRLRKFDPLDISSVKYGNNLSSSQKELIEKLILEFNHIFSRSEYDLGKYLGPHKYRVELTTNEHQPRKFVKIPDSKKELVDKHIEKLLSSDVIEETDTDRITTSFIIIKKKDGTFRLANDSRSINNVTKSTSNFCIPKISDILSQLSKHKFYSSLDMNSSYFQIPIDESQRNLYTFLSTDNKTVYRYKFAPFGSKLISFVFQGIVAGHVLKNIGNCISYIDDIIIFNMTFEDHLKTIKLVFERFSSFNLSLKVSKCQFGYDFAEAFGFRVDILGFSPLESRVEKLKLLKIPESRKKLKSSLQSLCYYRNHIKDFSDLTCKMYRMTSEKVKFEVDEEMRENWRKILDNLSETILCTSPVAGSTYILQTDASSHAIGCTLLQEQDGVNRIILCDSKVLTPAQQRYAIAALELFSVAHFLKKYEQILLFETHFHLEVDNISVCHLLKNISRYPISGYNPTSRYLIYISKFSFSVTHKKGDDPSFLLTDLMSRRIISPKSKLRLGRQNREVLIQVETTLNGFQNLDDFETKHLPRDSTFLERKKVKVVSSRKDFERSSKLSCATADTLQAQPAQSTQQSFLEKQALDTEPQSDSDGESIEICCIFSRLPSLVDKTFIVREVFEKQKNSVDISERLRKLRSKKSSKFFAENRTFNNVTRKYLFYDSVLKLVVVPNEAINNILELVHKHEGLSDLLSSIRSLQLYIPTKLIIKFYKECNVCMSSKSGSGLRSKNNQTINMNKKPFEIIHTDISFLGSIPILASICEFTKFVQIMRLTDQTAECLAYALATQILAFNVPHTIISDNGANYRSSIIEDLLGVFNINHRFTSAYNSPANGLSENINRQIQEQLRIMGSDIDLENKDQLDYYLKLTEYILNSRKSKALANRSPIEIVLGYLPAFPFRIPSISNSKKMSLPGYMRQAYVQAEELRKAVIDIKTEKLSRIAEKDILKINVQKGDIVKIRRQRRPGELKKITRPFSDEYYIVISVLHFAKTLLVEEIVDNPHIRKNRFKIPLNRVKKCFRKSPEECKEKNPSTSSESKVEDQETMKNSMDSRNRPNDRSRHSSRSRPSRSRPDSRHNSSSRLNDCSHRSSHSRHKIHNRPNSRSRHNSRSRPNSRSRHNSRSRPNSRSRHNSRSRPNSRNSNNDQSNNQLIEATQDSNLQSDSNREDNQILQEPQRGSILRRHSVSDEPPNQEDSDFRKSRNSSENKKVRGLNNKSEYTRQPRLRQIKRITYSK